MATPDDAVADVIDADATLSAYVKGTNLFRGKPRDALNGVPIKSIWCLSQPGRQPMDYCQSNTHSPEDYFPAVQIIVRGVPGDFQAAQADAKLVLTAVHDVPPSGYIYCRATHSEPIYIGENDDESHEFSINVDLMISE